jgi:hypothetical protein
MVGRESTRSLVKVFVVKVRKMMRRQHLSQMIGITLVALLVVACSTTQPSPTATLVPTTTPVPTPIEGAAKWDYVALGESMNFGMISRYKEMLEQDLGVSVELHDWALANDHSSSLLERLRTNEQLRQDLREAEVVTFQIPIRVIVQPFKTFEFGDPGECGGDDNQDCLRDAFEAYKADTDQIIAEIVSLRSPSDAVIRAQDVYQIKVRETQETGSFEIINGYWRDANAHTIEVATRYVIPVARVYDAFMGEDGKDPRDQGLMVSDGLHPSPEGAILMAELFQELGYEPLAP